MIWGTVEFANLLNAVQSVESEGPDYLDTRRVRAEVGAEVFKSKFFLSRLSQL